MCMYKICNSKKEKRTEKKVSRSIVGGEMNAPAKNVQRAANESDHRGFPRELHELVERRCRRRRRRALPSATPTPRRALPSPRAVASRRCLAPPSRHALPSAGTATTSAAAAAVNSSCRFSCTTKSGLARELGTIADAAPAVAHPLPLSACRRRRRLRIK